METTQPPYEFRYKHADGTTVQCMIIASSWEEAEQRLADIAKIFVRDLANHLEDPVPEGESKTLGDIWSEHHYR